MAGGTKLKISGWIWFAIALAFAFPLDEIKLAVAAIILGTAYVFAGDVLNALRQDRE